MPTICAHVFFIVVMSTTSQGPVIVACPDGGTSIEDLAESNPELILKVRPVPFSVYGCGL